VSERNATKDDEDLVSLVNERYDASARSMSSIIAAWEEARLFYRGDQWLKPMGTRYAPSSSPAWRVRLTVNKFIPIVESAIASYLKTRPIILANAATDEDADIKSAKISELLLRYYYDELIFDDLNFDTVQWLAVLGSAFQRVRWDPTRGRKVPVMAESPAVLAAGPGDVEAELPPEAPELVPVGQPVVDVISPFAMAVEPGAEKFESAAWCIVTEVMLRTDIETRWDVKVDAGGSSSGLHIPVYVDRDSKIVDKERVAVHAMYERPCPKYPQGRLVWTTRHQKLAVEDLPYGEIQIKHFTGIPLPGELWPTSIVSQGIPLQLELNRGRSQLIENRNLCSRPQVIAAFGAVEDESWNNRPGSINHWDPIAARGIEPHYMSPPQVPQWVMNILSLAEQDLMDLTSRHEVSQGGSSSNVTSGRQAAIYKGADDARLTPSIRRFEKGLETIGKWMLREAKEHLSGEQVIRIVGANRTGEYLKFAANDVSDSCNVRFEIASQLPWARESQRQQIMYLNQQGKIDDQTMFELLEMPTSTRIYESEQQHKQNARYENEMLKQGYFPPIATDKHEVHIREHEQEANRPESRQRLIEEMQQQSALSGEEAQIPGSVQFLMQHLEAHRKALPQPQPAPPMTRVNLNVERLITELAAVNPQLAAQLLPYAVDLMGDASGYKGPAVNGQQDMSGMVQPPASEGQPPSAGDMGTPMGGMDGQMYQEPAGGQPSEGEMYGGGQDLG